MSQMKSFFLLIALLILSGCGNQFDRTRILDNAADNLIIPAYEDFKDKSDSLHIALMAFTENPTEGMLQTAQERWKASIKSWKRAELYNFGPVESMVLVTSIDRWPTSEAGIETVIEEYDDSDDYLVRVGSNRRGLPAIEYLLFHSQPEEIITEFEDANRKAYLLQLSASVAENSALILDEWQNEYKHRFIEKTGNRPNSGITLLANEMGYLLEMIRMDKLEIPFGKQTMGALRLHMLESEYAGISKQLIRENLESARHTFNGGEGTGFDDYLDGLNIRGDDGMMLSEAINQEYANALAIIDNMDGSLAEVMQNDKEAVEQLIESVQQLYIYTEVDMISQLNILDTFSDNDGD
ncbi:imelysin family protein [Gracilimonas mengyeensis]|uniref:Imelysin-like domain-containing protein n=1 Tax=Gracilimonas mengyeensis TaxID=1302730 RepID=A0A521BI08_9BACT|nr:imelysin family protein [Gracilimonas mengyeensis]SMO46777.1 hypothetical protein SAMN06265219_102298 [Gracilimonas mengyeensis]